MRPRSRAGSEPTKARSRKAVRLKRIMTTDRPVLIAGGGIGGLATALGLAQKGFSSIVLERAPKFGEIGAGIQLGPNAFHAFDYLGVGDAARKMAVYIDRLRLMDAITSEDIASIPLDERFRKRFKNPYAVVHRGDLYGVLLRACRDSSLVELRGRGLSPDRRYCAGGPQNGRKV
jgi:3-hydroxybenzoate 6-monooxygenase